MKDAFFNVKAKYWEAPTWRLVARFRGFHSVGAWLAELGAEDARRHVEAAEAARQAERKRLPLARAWKAGTFGVNLWRETRFVEVEVEGLISPPFGVYRFHKAYSLAHLPTGHTLFNSARRRDCQQLAAELATCDVSWDETNGERLSRAPGIEAVKAILTRFEREKAERYKTKYY
jgi:hypothetical protein